MGSKTVPIEISSPHSYSTSIHTAGLCCTVWPQYTMWQTDRAMIVSHLCYGIGSLKTPGLKHRSSATELVVFMRGWGKKRIISVLFFDFFSQFQLMKSMSSTDTPLNTVHLLQQKQKVDKLPYIVLSGGKGLASYVVAFAQLLTSPNGAVSGYQFCFLVPVFVGRIVAHHACC